MIWKAIQDYEDLYLVSDDGKVKSLIYNRLMFPADNGIGYLQVGLTKNKIRKRFYVHRLVYEAFNGKIEDGYEIDHLDNNKSNNSLCNLILVTRQENMKKCLKDNPHILENLVQNQIR